MTVPSNVKKKRKNKTNKKIKFVALFFVFGYFAWILTTQQFEFQSKNNLLAQANASIEQQSLLSKELSEKYELVNSPEYIEKVAREELGYARPDEIIFYDATLKK